MGRVLALGPTGFAGGHFVDAAAKAGLDVVTAARRPGAADLECDLLDTGSLERALARSRPGTVVNLAGAASVGRSWSDPGGAFEVNATGVLNLLEAVRSAAPGAHVVCISSGDAYGMVAERMLPVTEGVGLAPVNPYGTSKAAMELVCGQYERTAGLRIAIMRSFNHLGPGQSDSFAASSFARQVAEAEAGGRDGVELRTGDLSPERDFSDVRDVVGAYVLAVERGLTGAFNVCSGRPRALTAIVDGLARATTLEVTTVTERARLRPSEAARIYGSFDRLQRATGWAPRIPLDRTLGDLVDWWRARL